MQINRAVERIMHLYYYKTKRYTHIYKHKKKTKYCDNCTLMQVFIPSNSEPVHVLTYTNSDCNLKLMICCIIIR